MALIEFENYPNTDTAINAANLNNNFSEILNLIYPIGRGFIDFTNTDYSNYLGFTWERELIGKVPVGIDSNDTDFNTIGKTGGEKTHILTIPEIPAHSHDIRYQNIQIQLGSTYSNELSGSSSVNVVSSDTGSNYPHNNLQPYEVVAFWKRIA